MYFASQNRQQTQLCNRETGRITTDHWNFDKLLNYHTLFKKPAFQRPMQWTLLPEKKDRASFREYIDFLFK